MKHSSRFIMTTGFVLLLLLLLIIIATGISNMAAINERMDRIVNGHNVKTNQISTLRTIARERSLLFYHMLLVRDPFVVDEEIQQVSQLAGEFIKIRDQLLSASMSRAEREQLDQMLEVAYKSTNIQQQLTELLKAERFNEASKLLQEKSLRAQNLALNHYDAILDEQRRLGEEAAREAGIAYQRSFAFMLLLSGIVITLGSAVSIYTIRKTSHAEQSLHRLNLELEKRVDERTNALTAANNNLQGTIQTLREAQSQLVQAEKMAALGGMVAGISHEINTPIGNSMTTATALLEEFKSLHSAFMAESMKRSTLENFIAHGMHGCEILVSNLLRAVNLIRSFKQVAVDQGSDDWRTINLHEYIDAITTSLKPAMKGHNIKVVNASDSSLTLYTHPGAIYQIISNLLINALTHAYEPGQAGVIRIDATRVGNEIQLDFSDDGKGIPAEIQSRIFDPFFTTRRGAGGSGLGLHIVFNLVTGTLNGVIHQVKEMAWGAAFRIQFPLRAEDGK